MHATRTSALDARPDRGLDQDLSPSLFFETALSPPPQVRVRARKRWHKASRVVSLAKAHQRHALSDEQFVEMARASQQRYARSAFGFDGLLLRFEYFRSTPPAEW